MSSPSSPLASLLSQLGKAIAPGLDNVQAQAQNASDQLTLAFEVLIAEGAIVIALLGLQTVLMWKYMRKG